MCSARRALVLLLTVGAAVSTAVPARADGDPASDYLISQQVYFPAGQNVPLDKREELVQLVRSAKQQGFEVRIAIIATPVDLGAVKLFWRKPQPYARFLGQELNLFYPRRLLIVMPDGYGLSERGVNLNGERGLLDSLPKPGSDLIDASESAVERLAAQHGVHVKPTASGSNQNRGRLEIIVLVVGVLIALALVKALRTTGRGAAR